MNEARELLEDLDEAGLLRGFGNNGRSVAKFAWAKHPDDYDWLFERYIGTADNAKVWQIDGQGHAPEVTPEFVDAIKRLNPEVAERIRAQYWGSTVRDDYLNIPKMV